MSATVIVSILTALAAVVVLLTRLRLGRESGAAGRLSTGRAPLQVHTVAGVLALITWTVFLIAPDDSRLGGSAAGIVALACWWITALAGLLILVRWLPSRGQRAAEVRVDSWSRGPGLSLLAHLGMLAAVLAFTWAYLTAAV